MANYVLGIDETGGFWTTPFVTSRNKHLKSFACGVCFIDKSDDDIKNIFFDLYEKFNGCRPAGPNLKDALEGNAFHSTNLNKDKLKDCRSAFAPIIDKVFCSEGLPSLYANNQDWWLTSVVVVIQEFLDSYDFNNCDKITIHFDGRKDTTWGTLDEGTAPYNPATQQWDTYRNYHEFLKARILDYINPIIKHRNLNVKLYYGQDTKNGDIAVADIAAKLVVGSFNDKTFLDGITVKKRSCRRITNLNSPESLFDNNQVIEAFSTILSELEQGDGKHMEMVPPILNKLSGQEEQYSVAWSMFYDFIKNRIKDRKLDAYIPLVKCFTEELEKILPEWKNKLDGLKELNSVDFIILITEFYSHVGEATVLPFSFEEFEKSNEKNEGRILRRWENYIRFYLRVAQICFNGYDFNTIVRPMESLWEKQKQIMQILKVDNDNHSSAIMGTLGQAYAFIGENSKAEEIFNEGLETSTSKKGQTYSYLFTIYHKAENTEKCREYFRLCTGIEANAYHSKFSDDRLSTFDLLSYEKLRALELKVNGKTDLPRFEIEKRKDLGNEYPIPLIKKWAAIALYFENKDDNKDLIISLFNDAASDLIKESGFAVRSMSLTIYQCSYLLGLPNGHYEELFKKLTEECKGFAEYAKSVPGIEKLDNNLDIWERACLLPFYYA